MGEIREGVRARYARIATAFAEAASPTQCCQDDARGLGQTAGAAPCCDQGCGCNGYRPEDLASLGLSDAISLGCGNPTALAALVPGQVVLDLGSGAGLDVLLSAKRVGSSGHAYGVDMTDQMVELAEHNRQRAGVANASFLKGTMEQVPMSDASVDVVISNCVINLAEDKAAVLAEAFRVLRPGGTLAVSDMVEVEPLPASVKREIDAWAGCIAGTIAVSDYRELLQQAGFEEVRIELQQSPGIAGPAGRVGSAAIWARKPRIDL